MADDFSGAVSGDLTFAGYDQGIDFTGSGHVLAIGDGTIVRIERGTFQFKQGTGSIIVYGIGAGKYVYIMEAITVAAGLSVGDQVQAGQVLGSVDSSYPGIEMGWATSDGQLLAPLGTTSYGQDFARYVTAVSTGTTPTPSPQPGLRGPVGGSGLPRVTVGGAKGATGVERAVRLPEAFSHFTHAVGVTIPTRVKWANYASRRFRRAIR